MDVTQLVLTWGGWPNGEKLALTCVQIWSRPKWAQVIASQRKCTQALAKRSRKLTQVFNLRLLATPFDQGVTHSVHMKNDRMNKNDWLHSHNINIKLMVKKLTCACAMHSAMTPSWYLESTLLYAQATPESFVVELILIALINKENHQKWNNRDSNEAHDYQLGLRNLTGRISDFKSLFSGLAWFSSAAQGVQRIWVPGWSAPLSQKATYLCFISFCSRDYLQITNEENRVFGKYCDNMTGKTVLVSGKYALIKFHSHSNIQNRGFLMTFSAVGAPGKKW